MTSREPAREKKVRTGERAMVGMASGYEVHQSRLRKVCGARSKRDEAIDGHRALLATSRA
jgi:hypothetical protein